MIPEGWERRTLGEVTELQRGFDLPTSRREPGPYPIISSSGRSGSHSELKVKGPGIVTGRYGSIGEIFYVEEDHWPLNTSLWVKDFHGNDKRFAYYLLQTVDFQKYSDKTGVPGVNRNDLHRISALVPPIREQKKIAEILTTWDEAIAVTQKLLANAEAQKRALMRRLLTDKRRAEAGEGEWRCLNRGWEDISGGTGMVPEGWQMVPLAQVVEFLDGRRKPIKSEDRAIRRGKYPYYGATGIIDWIDDYIFDEPILLIGEDGENILSRNLPHVFEVDGKVWVNNHAHVVRCRRTVDRTYLCSYLESLDYAQYNTGTAQPKLNKKVCEGIPVLLPPLPEQKKIAEILSTWNRAIETTKKLHANAQAQKRALMEQLLTGKRRVRV